MLAFMLDFLSLKVERSYNDFWKLNCALPPNTKNTQYFPVFSLTSAHSLELYLNKVFEEFKDFIWDVTPLMNFIDDYPSKSHMTQLQISFLLKTVD
jgi:hypothetical protein